MNHYVGIVISVILVMFSAILHEVAHGWVAYRCGDNTAKDAGRLTLNPLAHIDPFGSVILPIIMGIAGGPIFAFAKPVPYNPYNLRNRRRDELLVALAGPCANLLQAIVGAALFQAAFGWYSSSVSEVAYYVCYILSSYVYVNLVLMFFNLIPLPPLDGSSIIGVFLSGSALEKYYQIQRYSLPILLIVLYLIPMVTSFDPLGIYLDVTAGNLYSLLLGA
ncbi:MAG: site-2 protease family protein [Atopobiaceae bacterium]|jgi:Zn-dependent protease|nr:site-2 protease family protein [Atopobiaceae bacterium]MCH4213927.1 site-2 protease family protein [Atopobiaceae bacterium]MCH4229823.1 site-2 protease family protein [Atopobiaceae bacterium]MCH4275610.1 site-2 protease family protein [Atopobiaceae bacterium]MCI1227110.1 site-2 protease family protein [Atopobiaceae bacterium]